VGALEEGEEVVMEAREAEGKVPCLA